MRSTQNVCPSSKNVLSFISSANIYWASPIHGLPRSGKESACQCRMRRRHQFNPWVGKIPWRWKWQPTLVFLPGESQGQGSPAGCSSRSHKESDVTSRLSMLLPYILGRLGPSTGLCVITQMVLKHQLVSPGSRIFLSTLSPERSFQRDQTVLSYLYTP